MEYTEEEKLSMKIQIFNHHPFWKKKSVEEFDELDKVKDWILKELFLDSI